MNKNKMKQFFTILLMLTFCTMQTVYAKNMIVIGSDGHIRYENETSEIMPVTTEVLKKTKNILQELTLISDKGKIKKLYIDKNGKIKKIQESGVIDENIKPIDDEKNKEFQKYIADAPKMLINTKTILRSSNYKSHDDSSNNKKEYVKVNLLDGDYAVWYKGSEYIAEYHHNGELMGLVKAENILDTDNKVISVYYEYRSDFNLDDCEGEPDDMGLKHILFLDMEKNNYTAQYIYLYDGSLLCSQVNNTIYISEEGRNLIPDWSKRISNKIKVNMNKYEKFSRKTLRNTFIMATSPTWIVPPAGLIFFSLSNMVGGKDAIKKGF